MEYKMIRLFTYLGAGFLPLVITTVAGLAFFISFGNNFFVLALLTGVTALFAAFICGFGAYQLSGSNPWIKTIQGEAMLLLAYSSGGNGQIYNCITKPNPSGGIDIVTTINKQPVVLAYDKPMSYRMLAPVRAVMTLVHPKKSEAVGDKLDKAKTVITIENEDFDKIAFRFGYITVLFYNMETGTLTNKFAVNELEKFYAMKYLSLHLDRKLDIYIAELRMARKNFFDALLSKLSAFMRSKMFPVMIIVIIAFFAIILLSMFAPQIGAFFNGFLPQGAVPSSTAPAQAAISPITHGATP